MSHVRIPLAIRRGQTWALLLLLPFGVKAMSQSTVAPPASEAKQATDLERRLGEVTDALAQTQKNLEQSLVEIQRLRAEVEALRAQAGAAADFPAAAATAGGVNSESSAGVESSMKEDIEALKEQQDILQAEVKQHEQSKVETSSKYNLKVNGLALFNAFSNAGVVDNTELPTVALPRPSGASHGSVGASLHQTVLGLQATGPLVGGARSSAQLSVDFFGGSSTNSYGYSTLSGVVRLRQAMMDLDWKNTTAEFGYTGPLISPLSPTSYATVAQPALSGSGNLWTWSPQVRMEQRLSLSDRRSLGFEGGLIFPQSPEYSSIQLDSPVEASRRPGVEGRLSYRVGSKTAADQRALVLGVGAYKANQFYNSATTIHSWAMTGDWQIPLGRWIDIDGEVYRGLALGGLGGGGYKDVLSGTDPVTGLARTVGVDSAGGWGQLKLHVTSTIEGNAVFGVDDAYSRSFDEVIVPASINPALLTARNSSVIGNLIFRPMASLILSPEYRRILTWRYSGTANVANVYTLSVGYQF